MEIQTKTRTSEDFEINDCIPKKYPTEKNWLSCIPEEYKNAELSNCKELPAGLVSYGEQWASSPRIKSLYLYGEYGSGKTTFAFSVIRKLMQNLNGKNYFWPNYLTGRQLDSLLLKATKNEEGDQWEIQKWSESDLLFIDDIDKITGTERFRVQLFEIINKRYSTNKPTIITSNYELSKLGSFVDGSVMSRMSDISKWEIVEFPKKDLRPLQVLKF